MNVQGVEAEKSAKVKKPRTGARGISKVKTGCQTCKIRHKKCDEAKPVCSQCVNTGRKCDFDLGHAKDNGCSSLELLRWRHRQSTTFHSLNMLRLKDYEALYIKSYQDSVTRDFSATFEVALWQRVVLEAIYMEQCVRDAVFAIGALNRLQETRQAGQEQRPEYECSLEYYNSAIKDLNERLDVRPQSWELATLGAFLFVALEVMQGHEDRAQMHFRSAFAILKSFPGRITTMMSSHTSHSAFLSTADTISLFNAFSRLDPQASSFSALNSLASSQLPVLPQNFTDLGIARECLLLITNAMNSFFSRITLEDKTLRYSPLPALLARDLSMIQSALDTWFQHFQDLMSHYSSADINTSASIQVLIIHHHVAQIQASTHFFRDELIFDSYLAQFRQIVSLAASVTKADQVQASSHGAGPCFILDIGMVQPLFYVARKCRDRCTRRVAIEVMENVRRTRVHDVQLLVGVARWVIATEEDESELSNGVVAEEKRLRDIQCDFNIRKGHCVVSAWRQRTDRSRGEISTIISPRSLSIVVS